MCLGQLQRILLKADLNGVDSDSKFCDNTWTLKMGEIAVGLKGLTDMLRINPDDAGALSQGLDGIQKEVKALVKSTVNDFVSKLENLNQTGECIPLREDILIIIRKLKEEADLGVQKKADSESVNNIVRTLENELDLNEVKSNAVKMMKSPHQDQEMHRVVSNLMHKLRPNIQNWVAPDPQNPRVQKANSNVYRLEHEDGDTGRIIKIEEEIKKQLKLILGWVLKQLSNEYKKITQKHT